MFRLARFSRIAATISLVALLPISSRAGDTPADASSRTARPADGECMLTLPEIDLNPNSLDWTGRDIRVPIRATGDSVCSVDLAFVAETRLVVPDSPFVAMHAFQGIPDASLDWNAVGDTILISIASGTPVTLANEPVVELSFRIGPEGVQSGCIGVRIQLTWLPRLERTNIDEQAPSLTDGTIVVYPVSIEEGHPRRFALAHAAPNPFNPSTTLRFAVPRDGAVRLAAYDVTGRHVRTLVDRRVEVGEHSVVWDGFDVAGRAAASGVYVVRLEHTGESHRDSQTNSNEVRVRRVTLLR